jgi:hypothetical protein
MLAVVGGFQRAAVMALALVVAALLLTPTTVTDEGQ